MSSGTDSLTVAALTAASQSIVRFLKKRIPMQHITLDSVDSTNAALDSHAGEVEKLRVRDVCERLIAMGCDEVAVSDTIGAAAPRDVFSTVGHILESIPSEKIALHFHDTYGTALANVYAGLQLGITRFDASAGGLGGCPYAKGASGNLATEDLVYFLDRMRIESGVNLQRVFEASNIIANRLGRALPGKQWQRLRASKPRP